MSAPIGIFDSGLGGLTVLKEIAKRLPEEQLFYFGDTARVPYGNKSGETILRYSQENSRFLLEHGVKALVIACNSASVFAADRIREEMPLPVIDVVGPGIETAVRACSGGAIALLGTKATIASGVYQREIAKRLPGVEVIPIGCPLFVPLVEEGLISHPAARLFVKEYLAPLKGRRVGALLLACTHYPLLSSLIQEEAGEEVKVIDSASACAERVAETVEKSGCRSGPNRFFVSDAPEAFKQASEIFLEFSVEGVDKIESLPKEAPHCIGAG